MNKLNLVKFPQIRIKLAIENYSQSLNFEIKKLLVQFLNSILEEKIELKFRSSQPYWKFPEETMCYFDVFSKEIIKVKEIVKDLDLNIGYTIGPCVTEYNSIDCHYIDESATWSAFAFGEFFLHKDIRWFNVFTVGFCDD